MIYADVTTTVYPRWYLRLLSFLCFLYVLVTFGLSGIPGVSRLGLFSAAVTVLMMTAIVFNNKFKFPAWSFLLFFFYVYMALPSLAIDKTSYEQLGTLIVVLVGTISIGLLVQNNIVSYKVIIYGSLTAAVINIIAVNLGIETAPISDKGRFSGLMANPNALCINMVFPAFLVWIFPERFNRIVRLLSLFVAFYGVYITGSRKGLLLAASLLFLIAGNYLVKASRLRLVLALFVLLVTMVTSSTILIETVNKYGTDIVAVKRFLSAFEGNEESFNSRKHLIGAGYDLWKESPIVGHGFTQFGNLTGYNTYSHNNYIELAVSGGIIAIILFYSIHCLIAINAIKNFFLCKYRVFIFLGSVLIVDSAMVVFYDKAVMCTLISLLAVLSGNNDFLEDKMTS